MAKAKNNEVPVIESNPALTPVMASVGVTFDPQTKLFQAVILETRGNLVVNRIEMNPDVKQAALDMAYQAFLERIVAHDI